MLVLLGLNHRSAPVDARQHAMLDVAVKYARAPETVSGAHISEPVPATIGV